MTQTQDKLTDNNQDFSLVVVATGSKGNCSLAVDRSTGDAVVIDCGVAWKRVYESAREAKVPLERIGAVLVTHDHSDHTKGIGVTWRGLAKKGCTADVWSLPPVLAQSREIRSEIGSEKLRAFEHGQTLIFGSIEVLPFRTSHDAAASCGFRLTSKASGRSIGFMTDTGFVTPEALDALSQVHVLALESNHDVTMLREGPYPYYLKERILSNRGHLSNDQAAEALARLSWPGLETVVAMHGSEHNNLPSLARSALQRTAGSAFVLVGSQQRALVVSTPGPRMA